jgi:hypothetical protein
MMTFHPKTRRRAGAEKRMQRCITVVDRRGDSLEARCVQFDWDPHSWQVELWGPHGLRYSVPIRVHPGMTLEQVLQRYVDENQLVAMTHTPPKGKHYVPPAL